MPENSDFPLKALVEKPSRMAIGLMSGTSLDGIDAALVNITGRGLESKVDCLCWETYPLLPDIRKRITRIFEGKTPEICQMNFVLGKMFAVAAREVARKAGIPIEEIDFIASHGQTIYHIPRGKEMEHSTLQIGESAVIAEMTGRVVVSDFRTRDIAAGGDGAPLVPYAEYLLFAEENSHRVLVNIGGMANMTLLERDMENIIAFDTGPGNVLIDEIARKIDPECRFDENGAMAARGKIDEHLLSELLVHPYLEQTPPKSTGRETFGVGFADKLLRQYPQENILDLLATVTAFTARSILQSLTRFILPWTPVEEMIFSGGGIHNRTLMKIIDGGSPGIRIRTTEDFGIPADAKEAIAFALIGNETLHGRPGNVPRATGAGKQVILGKITLP
jgi:anhydro-N-acetylmuramic acid kinase